MRSLVYIAVLVAVVFSMFKAEIGPTMTKAAKDTREIWKNLFSHSSQSIYQEKLNSLASDTKIKQIGEGKACKFADIITIKIDGIENKDYILGSEPIDVFIAGMKQGEVKSILFDGNAATLELIEIKKLGFVSEELENAKIFDNILTYSRIFRPQNNVACHLHIYDFEGKTLYEGDIKLSIGAFKYPTLEYLIFGKPIDSIRSVIANSKYFKDFIGSYNGMVLIDITTKPDA